MHWPSRITWRAVKSDPDILRSADRRLIDEFVSAMRRRHYAPKTVARYRCCLVQTACSLKRGLATLSREEVAGITRRLFGRTTSARRMARGTLHTWLKFVGRFARRGLAGPWQRWLDDYAGFMDADRGLASISRTQYLRVAQRYLWWQFRAKAASWRRVSCADIWRYAAKLRRDGYSPRSLNLELCVLRQFLRFVHLRGHGSRLLAEAVPTFSERGHASRCDVATDEERRRLLSSFDRRTPTGRRDHAMAICMAELGLRCVEVARLRLSNIDWSRAFLTVPAAKGGLGRVLPLAAPVATAMRDYLQIRPPTDHDILFVGIGMLAGRAVNTTTVSHAVRRACKRCGLRQAGTHRLRHAFATRLMHHGANLKEIADLLGHRLLKTTNVYTHTAPDDLRALVRPWPE
jgi:site-specific recombinase XerD